MSFRKILTFLGYCTATLVALLLLALVSVYALSNRRLTRKHPVQVASVAVPTSADEIARGRHIVTTRACADCHGADFGGRKVIDDPLAGKFYGPNITRGAGGLPSDYTDHDFVRAIRHGLARDGRALALMPSLEYAELSDEDVGAMIAYLKSLPGVDRARGPVSPGPLIRLLMLTGEIKLSADEIDHTATRASAVVASLSADYGKYLATSCTGCHGPNLSGGKIAGAPPAWPAASNLTGHPTSPVKEWTEEQFMQTLRTRKRPDGTPLNPIMPEAYAQLTDLELKALWVYLRSLPATPTGVR